MTVQRGSHLDDIESWLVDTAVQAGMADRAAAPRLVHTWHSRTATLHQFTWGRPSAGDVVVKVHHNPDDAAAHFESMRKVAHALNAPSARDFAALSPLAFSTGLGAVLMPYAEGSRLLELVQDGPWASDLFRNELIQLFNACGTSLARYHSRHIQGAADARNIAQDNLSTRVAKVLGSKVDTSGLDVYDTVSQSYGDFHIGHIIVTRNNGLVLLDPPIEVRYEYAYRDIALFTYTLFTRMIHPRGLWRHPTKLRYREALVKAFLDGYADEVHHPFTTSDTFYINACEAFFLKRRISGVMSTLHRDAFSAYHLIPMKRRLAKLKKEMFAAL